MPAARFPAEAGAHDYGFHGSMVYQVHQGAQVLYFQRFQGYREAHLMYGPTPKPTALEAAEGYPGHRKGKRKREPKPDQLTAAEVKSRCPKELRAKERRWWRYYAEILAPLSVVTEADLVALGKLAKTTAERVKNEDILDKAGPIFLHKKKVKSGVTEDGKPIYEQVTYPIVSPVYGVVSAMRKQELELLREFGMTPSSRTRVQAIERDALNDFSFLDDPPAAVQ